MPYYVARKVAMSASARVGLVGLLLAMFFRSAVAWALDPEWLLSQYLHTAWRAQEGVGRGDINAITQTTDGYIWLGTDSGVFRFDGVRFVPWSPPGTQIALPVQALLGTHEGSLWIATPDGTVWQVKDQKSKRYSVPFGRYDAMLEDRSGVIWIARSRTRDNKGGLCRLDETTVHCFGLADGFPSTHAETLAMDSSGEIWAGSSSILTHWKPGFPRSYTTKTLQKSEGLGAIDALSGGADGSMWVGISHAGPGMGLQRFVNDKWTPFVVPSFDSSTLQVSTTEFDRNGDLWIGTVTQGLYRIHGSRVEHFDHADGLSGDNVENILEDHEGNMWVTTSGGLDCFKDGKVMSYSMQQGLSADNAESVVASRAKTIWVGNHGALDSLHSGVVSSIKSLSGLPGRRVTALLEDHDGGLWVGVDDGLYSYEKGRFRPIVRSGGKPTGIVQALTEDDEGSLWARITTQPSLLRIRDGAVVGEEAILPDRRVFAIAPRSGGGLWLGLDHGYLASYRHGSLETLIHSDSVKTAILDLREDSQGNVFGAAADGVIGWRNGKAQALTVQNGLPCDRMNSLILDRSQVLWLYASCGLISISPEELQRWWAHADAVVKYTLYDSFDGARPGHASFDPPASRSTDGKLWFVSGTVLQMIDPVHLRQNSLPPPVHIENIIADHKDLSTENGVRLAPLTRDVEIDYTGLSYVAPEKVRFRYRLEGRDVGWNDAGTRRQAFYNDLPPGHYRFIVMACNNDGLWNQSGDSVTFVVAPAFYQTTWFRVLLALLGIGLVYLIHSMWMRQVTVRIQARVEERQEERERIARELHDTLIQSVDGLMIYLQAAIDEKDHARSHQMLVDALDRADEVLVEGRERVRSLRTEAMLPYELSQALDEFGKGRAQEHGVEFATTVVGNSRQLDPLIRDEAFRIGREALANAFQHSGATKIELGLTFDRKKFRLSVKDNGKGVEPSVLERGKPGHWGLRGMRERAKRMSAHLEISSQFNAGTEVILTIPSRIAYPDRFRLVPFLWKGRWSDRELS